jgi:hypothetical protein
MTNLGIILGSTRPSRKDEHVGRWVYRFTARNPSPPHQQRLAVPLDQVIFCGNALAAVRQHLPAAGGRAPGAQAASDQATAGRT